MEQNNPFKQIKSSEQVPNDLKEQVMQSVDFAQVLMSIAELFSVNYVQSLGKLFKTGNDEDKD